MGIETGISWTEVKDFPGYQVSKEGLVLGKSGRVLRPSTNNSGHQLVVLYRDGIPHTKQVHILVLETFIGARPEGLEACHNDGNPQNNQLSNLRWDTRSNNQLDSVKHGTKPQGVKHPHAKITSQIAEQIRQLNAKGWTQRRLASQFNISKGAVQCVLEGITWRHANGD